MKAIRDMNRMELVEAVGNAWMTLQRNDILHFTVESMREALETQDSAALVEPMESPHWRWVCTAPDCTELRDPGKAVCFRHWLEYRMRVRV